MSVTPRHREGGQVVVLFALLLPVILAIGSIVLSVGNWYVHKRHLQTQVDAAALATGQDFVGCFLEPANTNTLVKTTALQYAGDTQRSATTTNLQVQQPNDVRVALNSNSYWPDNATPDPLTGYGLDWTMDGDPKTAGQQSSQPCDARFLDVKATDDRLPLLWRWIPLFPSAKAHATVEIHELPGLSGFLPWAVPESNPRTVAALFVDQDAAENQGVPIGVVPLKQDVDPTTGNPIISTVNGEQVNLWKGPAPGVLAPWTVGDSNGMIILSSRQLLTQADLQGQRLDYLCTLNATACFGSLKSAAGTMVATNKTGIGFVHGKPQSDGNGQATATVTDVLVSTVPDVNGKPTLGNGCPDGNLTDTGPYYVWTQRDCDVRISAQVDFGSDIKDGASREVRVGTTPFGNKCNGGIAMQKTTGLGGLIWYEQEQKWTTVAAGSGQNNFYLCWNGQRVSDNAKVDGTFGDRLQAMVFSANTDPNKGVFSGPVASAKIRPTYSEPKGPAGVSVEVGLIPPLTVTPGNAKPLLLRIAGAGSLNQALACDKGLQLSVMVRDGCKTPYQVNKRDLVCNPPYTVANLPPALPPPDPDPWPDCIQAKTGQVAEMSKGLHDRFEAPPFPKVGCPDNNWIKYRAGGPVPLDTDPRFVTLVVAEYGTFNDEGNKVLPITKFGGFYATGWFTGPGGPGSGMAQGCSSPPYPNDPPPTCPSWPSPNPNDPLCDPGAQRYQGAVWGYFVKQVFPSPQRPGQVLCVFNQIGVCSADLVK